MQGPQAASCDRDNTLLQWNASQKTGAWGKASRDCRGDNSHHSHIIIGAIIAKHGDVPAANLEDKKGKGIQCHGCEGETSLPFLLPLALDVICTCVPYICHTLSHCTSQALPSIDSTLYLVLPPTTPSSLTLNTRTCTRPFSPCRR